MVLIVYLPILGLSIFMRFSNPNFSNLLLLPLGLKILLLSSSSESMKRLPDFLKIAEIATASYALGTILDELLSIASY